MLRFVYTEVLTGKERFIKADSAEEARNKLREMKTEFRNLNRTFWGKQTYRGGTSILNIV